MARAKRGSEEFVEKWEPTREDALLLKEWLKPFSQRKINGKLVAPVEQYSASMKYSYIDEGGDIVVRDAAAYGKLIQVHSYLQSIERFELERLFKEFPEEREAWNAKVRSMRPAYMGSIIKRMPAIADDSYGD